MALKVVGIVLFLVSVLPLAVAIAFAVEGWRYWQMVLVMLGLPGLALLLGGAFLVVRHSQVKARSSEDMLLGVLALVCACLALVAAPARAEPLGTGRVAVIDSSRF